MKNNKLISLVLALLVCFSLVVTVSATTDNQNLAIAVEANASTVVSANGTIKVSVMINENAGNLGVNFDIKWNPAHLEYVDKDVTGTAFEGALVVPQTQFNRVVITVGNPSLGVQFPTMAPKVEGTGKIVELTFKAKSLEADAKTSITIERYSYCDLSGQSVEAIGIKNLELSVLNANHQHQAAAEATCTTDKVCAMCGFVMEKAKGHTPGAAATCTTNQICTVCNAELAPVKGHTPGAAATCTTAQICKVCKVELVAAKGHNFADTWVNTDATGHWHACSRCDEKKDFAAHTLVNGVCSVCGYGCQHTGGTATCTAKAKCSICGNEYGELAAHELEQVEAKAATCVEAGWNAHEKCKNCDYTTKEEVAATGVHTFGEWETVKEATTKEAGEQKRTCSVCGATETQALPMLEAQFPWWIIVVAVMLVGGVVVIIVAKKKD